MNELDKTQSSLTLVERLKARRLSTNKCLLLDISGSMCSDVEPGKRKIDALRDIVKSILGNPICINFGTEATIGTKNNIPNPRGNTNMARAFDLMKSQGIKDALMLTDGEATDKQLALLACEGLNIQIMYIGAGERPKFLDELASRAGSFCTTEDLKRPKELGNKIQLLLREGNSTESKKGPICL